MAKENQERPNDGSPEMKTDITFPPIGEEEQPEAPATDPNAEMLAKLEERFEASQREFAEERARWQQTVDRLIQTQAAPRQEAPAQPEQPKAIDFGDLPDPVDKPEDFKRALAERFEREMNERMTSTLNQYQERNTEQQTHQQAFDAMWQKFQQDYSDLASKTTMLKGAILSEKEALQAQRLDPQKAILSDPDGFMRRVATRMKQELGITEDPAPTTQEQPPAPASTPGQGQQTANRTGGVGGGSNLNAGGGGKGQKPPAFSEQLKKFQLDSGLI